MTGSMTESANAPSRSDEPAFLTGGQLELKGRVLPASNLTFFGEVNSAGSSLRCVYKPVSGERPLWDFPDGTLAGREVAAYTVSEALGWSVVPLTVLREGPFGLGMVQVWREPDPAQDPIDIVPVDEVPDGYLHVLDALDAHDKPVSLVHEDSEALRRMAVFDAVVNNADRKGGHVLAMPGGHRYGVDHGVSFHVENKLRTVLWGWAGEPLHPADAIAVTELNDQLSTPGTALVAALERLLDPSEIEALRRRCRRLLSRQRMPLPSGEWPAIPWPAF
jgi:uncharacterized repeat protein (TIGR03843 family)